MWFLAVYLHMDPDAWMIDRCVQTWMVSWWWSVGLKHLRPAAGLHLETLAFATFSAACSYCWYFFPSVAWIIIFCFMGKWWKLFWFPGVHIITDEQLKTDDLHYSTWKWQATLQEFSAWNMLTLNSWPVKSSAYVWCLSRNRRWCFCGFCLRTIVAFPNQVLNEAVIQV